MRQVIKLEVRGARGGGKRGRKGDNRERETQVIDGDRTTQKTEGGQTGERQMRRVSERQMVDNENRNSIEVS